MIFVITCRKEESEEEVRSCIYSHAKMCRASIQFKKETFRNSWSIGSFSWKTNDSSVEVFSVGWKWDDTEKLWSELQMCPAPLLFSDMHRVCLPHVSLLMFVSGIWLETPATSFSPVVLDLIRWLDAVNIPLFGFLWVFFWCPVWSVAN